MSGDRRPDLTPDRDGWSVSGTVDTEGEKGESRALTITHPVQRTEVGPHLDGAPSPMPSMEMAATEQLEAFREVRTRLLAMGAAKHQEYFSTLVVGMTAQSGASFVARNLAAVFTLQEHRMAMLVDCNLKHPTQHKVLGVLPDAGGLFDYLEQPFAAVERLAYPTPIPGLHLIPAGRPADGPREYFSSQHMKMMMKALGQAPCHVFLDGPPVKGSPDARILAELVDFVILVVGYASATPDEIGQAARLFAPAKFAGVVFNDHV